MWIDHLHKADTSLSQLLGRSEVATHPMVVGELAVGSIRNRRAVVDLMSNLASTLIALPDEVMAMVESRRLYGRGLSLIDAHLLASTVITPGTSLWTRDKKLTAAAIELGVAYAAQ